MSRGISVHCFGLLLAVVFCFLPAATFARGGKGAEVVQTKGDVHISHGDSTAVVATPGLQVEEGSIVQTGADSWIELRFRNLGTARVGPASSFSFRDGSRRMALKEGAAVVQTPKGAHGARIEGDTNIAIVAGTTALFECHPKVFKFLVLEGTARFFRPGHLGDSILVAPGRMVIGEPGTALADPVDFDITRFLKTSRFITEFSPLESAQQMAQHAEKQEREKARGILRSTNLTIFGGGTSVSVLNPSQSPSPGEPGTAASPPPPPLRDAAPPPVDRVPLSH